MKTTSKNRRMVQEIEAAAKFGAGFGAKEKLDPRVLEAMAAVPRHKFVPVALRALAYSNSPLPIGHGQTISQPYIVALMTNLLQPQKDHVILEVGTGCGYQAAVLSNLVKQVYTLEIVAALADDARRRLKKLGYDNVVVRRCNGHNGLPEHAPYDGIIVTAAASYIPPALIDQLKPGGRLVLPIGQPHFSQELFVVEKDNDGNIHTTDILPVAFVPLTGGHADSPPNPNNSDL